MPDETIVAIAADNQNDFGQLLKEYFAKLPKAGELVKGTVISIDKGAVRVDINGLMTGIVRGRELFSGSDEYTNLSIGDMVEATVIEQENETGEMELSFLSAGYQKVWDRMDEYLKEGKLLKGKIIQANKGGLMVQVEALSGFMPVSQLNPDHYPRVPGGDKNRILEHLRSFIGQELSVKVINVSQKDDKLIVSEKAVWEDEQKSVLESYKIGDTIHGEVSALTSFGAFVKFGDGLEGLVHISEIVWQRIDHPKDILKIGDKVSAQIIDLNKSKIYLSIKRLVDDPWKHVKDKYTVGQIVSGEVHKIEPFGLMVKLDDDIHGLAHVSEISDALLPSPDAIKERFIIGDTCRFEIVSIEPKEHRLGLRLEGVKGKSVAPPKTIPDSSVDQKQEDIGEKSADEADKKDKKDQE